MTADKDRPRVADEPQPATTERTQDTDKSGVKDRKASPGDDYGDTHNPSAEGNDPSLTAGKTVTRKVPDGSGA